MDWFWQTRQRMSRNRARGVRFLRWLRQTVGGIVGRGGGEEEGQRDEQNSSPAQRGRGDRRRWWRGRATALRLPQSSDRCPPDVVGDLIGILQHLARIQAKHLDALPGQPGIAPLIPLRLIAMAMTGAVHLDRETSFRAEEVEDVRPDRMLATEDWAVSPRAQNVPKA